MHEETDRIVKAKAVLEKIAQGINPINGERIETADFLYDPRIIRCFYFVSDVLDHVVRGDYRQPVRKLEQFVITSEQKSRVSFPTGNIGVNEFSKCVNACLDLNISKKLSGVELNKHLKALGILGEVQYEEGKTRTILTDKSEQFGFESEHRSFNGAEYEMVVINDRGKRYLLEQLEEILKVGS